MKYPDVFIILSPPLAGTNSEEVEDAHDEVPSPKVIYQIFFCVFS